MMTSTYFRWGRFPFPSSSPDACGSSLSDEELCQLYRKNQNQDIILKLLLRHESYMESLTYTFLKAPDSVEDFKGDLFLLLCDLLLQSQPKNFKHWLGRVVKNKLYDRLKKKRPSLLQTIPDKQLILEHQWDTRIDFELVREILDQLLPEQKTYIELAYLEGYKPREVAKKLSWSADKTRSIRQSALKKLKKLLGGDFSDFLDYLTKQ